MHKKQLVERGEDVKIARNTVDILQLPVILYSCWGAWRPFAFIGLNTPEGIAFCAFV